MFGALSSLLPGSDKNIQRLTITSHKMIDCSDEAISTFVVQTNPKNLEYSFGVEPLDGKGKDGEGTGIEAAHGASAPPAGFKGYQKMKLDFSFYADATGIVPIDSEMEDQFLEGDAPSIRKHLELLQNTTFGYEPESHGPPYLKLVWGKIFPDSSTDNKEKKSAVFKGTLLECTVNMKLFSLTGEPVKAEITLKIDSMIAPDAKPLGNSPDITHNVGIRYGDKMTTICKDIYGRYDSKICAAVANYNDLVNCDLQKLAGQKMVFPSIHLLNEQYLEEWDKIEKTNKKAAEEKIVSHFDYKVDLIGKKRAEQYFKMTGFDRSQPYADWRARRNKNKGYMKS